MNTSYVLLFFSSKHLTFDVLGEWPWAECVKLAMRLGKKKGSHLAYVNDSEPTIFMDSGYVTVTTPSKAARVMGGEAFRSVFPPIPLELP